MTQDDLRLIDEIFSATLDLGSVERLAYLEQRCAGNEALKSRVLELVAAAETTANELDSRFSQIRERLLEGVLADDKEDTAGGENLAGQRVDSWRLEKHLARGGLATVYLAQRDDGEYNQRAAFKVLRRGLDTDDLVARFRAERQILSALDHPGIASILDGGALEDGRPYLVLEYVDGKRITDYCREGNLPLRNKILLMAQVLRALHHAHRHLIVHRDIKPSNILVSAEGRVSLLDFGIAKLLDPDALPGGSTLTRTGMSLLTPGYSSPEQQAGETVTTASDIYQAGAVLFELLTGMRPQLAAADDAGLDVPPPSRALKAAAARNAVRGDLDAIVRKAMHADPTQRYSSADEMEVDLQRWLDQQPVLARPDTLSYRLGKLHKRRPWAIPTIVLAVIATVGYVYTLVSYNEQLLIEQRRATAAQAFMVDLLSSPDPFHPADPALGSDITVLEALDLGAESIDTKLADDAELRASVLASIADVYASLDRHDRAIEMREKALAIEQEVFGTPSEPVRASLQMLASEYLIMNDYDKATRYSREQLEQARQLYADHEPRLGVAEAAAGDVASAVGEFAQSSALWEQGIEKMRRVGDEFTHPLVSTLLSLANQIHYDEPDAASTLLVEAQRRTEARYGAYSLPMAQVRAQVAQLYSAAGEYEKAEQEFLAVIPVYESHVGRNHSQTLTAINNLGILYNRMEMPEKAEEIYTEVLDRYRQKFGELHRSVAAGYQNLATAITRAGRYSESIPMHQKAYELYKAILPNDQPVVAYPLLSKAFAEVRDGQYASAEATGREALDIVERTAAGSYLVGVAKCLVARSLEGQNDARAKDSMAAAHELLIGSIVSDTYRRFCRVPDNRAP